MGIPCHICPLFLFSLQGIKWISLTEDLGLNVNPTHNHNIIPELHVDLHPILHSNPIPGPLAGLAHLFNLQTSLDRLIYFGPLDVIPHLDIHEHPVRISTIIVHLLGAVPGPAATPKVCPGLDTDQGAPTVQFLNIALIPLAGTLAPNQSIILPQWYLEKLRSNLCHLLIIPWPCLNSGSNNRSLSHLIHLSAFS